MKNKGFTLIETIMTLFLLGLVSITVLNLLHTTFMLEDRNNRKLEMLNVGEMVIEKLKAFNYDSENELYIYETKVADIIDMFNIEKDKSLIISSNTEYISDYKIEISKQEKVKKLWEICVIVSSNKGEKYEEIKYKAIIPNK